ncbi:hypothetical protein [Bradyrhizobium sp. Gha]|uniref:hypothetical protein n=1 Tax=Bradyrhizobium sp. Gha TaxID=1855318 RepID=UPI001160BB46|nr:hypothetical protein [Bradyrhizobium sp. Gha]
MFPVVWRGRAIEATADLILQGQRFQTADIAAEVARTEADGFVAKASVRRSLTTLELRLVEDALEQGDRLSLDKRFAALKSAAVALFEVDPADSFFWLIYYWCQLTTEGFSPSQLKLLELSYDLGPNEGWVAIKRNRLALPVMSELPAGMRERVVEEFAGMVAAGLIVDAAASLVSASAPVREKLLAGLGRVPIAERERLARYLTDATTIDVVVPGVKPAEKRFY